MMPQPPSNPTNSGGSAPGAQQESASVDSHLDALINRINRSAAKLDRRQRIIRGEPRRNHPIPPRQLPLYPLPRLNRITLDRHQPKRLGRLQNRPQISNRSLDAPPQRLPVTSPIATNRGDLTNRSTCKRAGLAKQCWRRLCFAICSMRVNRRVGESPNRCNCPSD